MSEYLQSCPDIIVNGFKAISKLIDVGRPILCDNENLESADSHNGSDDESSGSVSAYFSSASEDQ